jgi:O-methyltransferase
MYREDIISTLANTGFMDDPKFINSYQKCVLAANNRLISNDYTIKWRIHTLIWAAKYASKLKGDFVEFGGGFGLFSSAIYEYLEFEKINKKYYLLDSFEGLKNENLLDIELSALNNYKQYGNWYDEVKNKFNHFENMIIIPGYIPDTLNELKVDNVAFVSIDFNCVKPEKDALEFIWDKVVDGGIIIFDDYGFPGHQNQKLSHDNFAKEKNCLIYTSPTGQGILIKS